MKPNPHLTEFTGISEVAETTTQLLALALQQADISKSSSSTEFGQLEQYVLQRARDYLSNVREGFILSVRSSSIDDRSEIRFLLERVLTDWDELSRELGLEVQDGESNHDVLEPESERVEFVRHQLLAFGMAAVAMGYLPRMPSKQVTFPHSYGKPPTYSDIPVPRTPGEWLWRIEELEQTLWQIMSRDLNQLVQKKYGPVRRTYGFFESSAWLSAKEVNRFGLKKRRRNVRLY